MSKAKNTAGLSPAEYAKKFTPLSSTQKPALPLEFRYSIGLPVTTPVDSIPTAKVPDVPILKKIWWFDCLPPEYRNAPFYAHGGTGDGQKHPCDIIATPVFYRNRVYVAIGGDPNHGSKNSRGNLVCIDPTKTGDVTQSGKVWNYDKLNATLTTVSIADGLVFVIDEASVIHCLDADTGQKYWTYALKSDRGHVKFRPAGRGRQIVCRQDHPGGEQDTENTRHHRRKHLHQLQRAVRCQWRSL